MPQIDQQSNTLLDKLDTHDAGIADLNKTVARGVPALRDASENVLTLNPSSTVPLLASPVHDAAVQYYNASVAFTNATGENLRPASADRFTTANVAAGIDSYGAVWGHDLASSGNLRADVGVYGAYTQTYDVYSQRIGTGDITSSNINSTSTVYSPSVTATNVYVGGGVRSPYYQTANCYVGDQAIWAGSTVMDVNGMAAGHFASGNCLMDFNTVQGPVGSFTQLFCSFFNGAPSARTKKRDVAPVSLLAAVEAAPSYSYRYTEQAAALMEGISADDWQVGPMTDDLPPDLVGPGQYGESIEYLAMVRWAWGAIGELSKKLDAALARIDTLEAAAT